MPVLDEALADVPLARIPVADDEPDEVAAPVAMGPITMAPIALSLVPDLAPAEDVSQERRAALLQELAFLDD